ncbi:hypothetical protein NUW54_g8591 [Trametes sanguinea]|uniref:Uncharacterized protein n=1 Tax=Trametes sanguinea TaxID=158606 RepID=A0ACC1PC91_9APHY|nr:hypothetical protein NUW54_g8591 [Trametes sanguinea]
MTLTHSLTHSSGRSTLGSLTHPLRDRPPPEVQGPAPGALPAATPAVLRLRHHLHHRLRLLQNTKATTSTLNAVRDGILRHNLQRADFV